MRLDAELLSNDDSIHCDICIIGGGPAGITLARELSGAAATVVVLESGGIEVEESAQMLNDGAVIGWPYAGLRQTRHRQLGGTVQTWNTPLNGRIGAKYVPLDPCDFLTRPDVTYSGWPFGYDELESYYERAQIVCRLGPLIYDGDCWCDQSRTFSLTDTPLRRSIYQFGPASAFTAEHLDAVGAADNVQLICHATACALKMRDEAKSVAAVSAASLAGNRFQVRARFYVLAAGAIENARLLLVSREPGQFAPGNEHDWLGRCFMEHPRDQTMSLIPSEAEAFARAAFYDRHEAADGTLISGRISVDPGTLIDQQLPNASLTLLPLPGPMSLPGRFGQIAARLKKLVGNQPSTGYGWSETFQPQEAYRGFGLLMNMEQFPHRDNRVVLSRELDPFGVPKPEVHWQWREPDQARLERLRTLMASSLEATGIGRIERTGSGMPDPNAHHHAGTTRMHQDPRYGVVDPNGRVHGTENLHVTGSSVFPTAGFANPTLTIVALALRLADHLKTRL
jgi:choline dehydrogenase-like flavoprotein